MRSQVTMGREHSPDAKACVQSPGPGHGRGHAGSSLGCSVSPHLHRPALALPIADIQHVAVALTQEGQEGQDKGIRAKLRVPGRTWFPGPHFLQAAGQCAVQVESMDPGVRAGVAHQLCHYFAHARRCGTVVKRADCSRTAGVPP